MRWTEPKLMWPTWLGSEKERKTTLSPRIDSQEHGGVQHTNLSSILVDGSATWDVPLKKRSQKTY